MIKEDYVHLYIGFDSINDEAEFLDVWCWLDLIKSVFGKYSMGGYTNNEVISVDYGFRFIDGDKHYLSMHVVYYETRIKSVDLVEIMKHTDKKAFTSTKFII